MLANGIASRIPDAVGAGALQTVATLNPASHPVLDIQVAAVFGNAYWFLFAVTALTLIPAAFLPRRPRKRKVVNEEAVRAEVQVATGTLERGRVAG